MSYIHSALSYLPTYITSHSEYLKNRSNIVYILVLHTHIKYMVEKVKKIFRKTLNSASVFRHSRIIHFDLRGVP